MLEKCLRNIKNRNFLQHGQKIQLTAVRDEKYRYELDKLQYYAKGCQDKPGADKI